MLTETEPFLDQLQLLRAAVAGDSLKGIREKAWDHFLELGLPDKKVDAFQYVPLRSLYKESFRAPSGDAEEVARFVLPECQGACLVFVNGAFSPHLSQLQALPKQVVVSSLSEAIRPYGAFFQSRFAKMLKEESDPFVVLNLALHAEGAFVFVPPQIQVETPLQLLHLISEENVHASGRLHLFLGKQAQLKMVSRVVVQHHQPCWINGVTDVVLEEGASLEHLNLMQTHAEAWHFEAFRATLKRDARLRTLGVATGSKSDRMDFSLSLLGENADATLEGIWMLEESAQAHTHAIVEHAAPHCRSMQHFKGILDDISQSSFQGKIFVRPIAQKTEAYQLNNNLILGSYAQAHSKPNLEIFADDVKASHGSTIAQLSEEHLFYLRARGLSTEEAKRLLVQGFCRELLDKIPYASIQAELREGLLRYLGV